MNVKFINFVVFITFYKFYATEIVRIILRENIDLKDTLQENGLLNQDNLVNLTELFSPFAEEAREDTDFESEEEKGDENDGV